MSDRLEALKLGEPAHVTWFRQPDVNGKPQLAAVVYDGEAGAKIIQIDGAALERRYLKDNAIPVFTPQPFNRVTRDGTAVITPN